MSLKVIRMILLFTLLSVAGQLMAFNQHCDMPSSPTETMSSMQHGDMSHENINHDSHGSHNLSERGSQLKTMPCCDMSSGCDMATCVALIFHSSSSHSGYFSQSGLVSFYKNSFHSLELDSFYKPPILS